MNVTAMKGDWLVVKPVAGRQPVKRIGREGNRYIYAVNPDEVEWAAVEEYANVGSWFEAHGGDSYRPVPGLPFGSGDGAKRYPLRAWGGAL